MSQEATQGYSRAPAREGRPFFAQALATEPGECWLCEQPYCVGDELLVHDDGRPAHERCGRDVEGWAVLP